MQAEATKRALFSEVGKTASMVDTKNKETSV